jgi:hypothetical protein
MRDASHVAQQAGMGALSPQKVRLSKGAKWANRIARDECHSSSFERSGRVGGNSEIMNSLKGQVSSHPIWLTR